MQDNGFRATTTDVPELNDIKDQYQVPPALRTCHTALVDGYVVEGHVPADLIQRLLRERPKVLGIAVAGMPLGSPGMESSRTEPYDVVTFDFDAAGNTTVYEKR